MDPSSHPATNRGLPLLLWLRLSDGQGHKHDLLLVRLFATHAHLFRPVPPDAHDTWLFHLSDPNSHLYETPIWHVVRLWSLSPIHVLLVALSM